MNPGFRLLLCLASAVLGTAAATAQGPDSVVFDWDPATAQTARTTFDRIRALEGVWHGRSTLGWTDEVEIRTIARGSAVLLTSRFTDEPSEGMATVFHLDGDRLVLTHYCEAGNQPRLRLAEVDNGADALHFVFDGGSNLPNREIGHMDEAILRLGTRTFHESWTWRADGFSRWMEDVEYQRTSADPQIDDPGSGLPAQP